MSGDLLPSTYLLTALTSNPLSREHIRRVHALRFGCEKCGLRFTKCRVEEVDDEKRRHVVHCTKPKVKLPDSEPEWMDKSQDENYRELNFQKDKGGPESCWHKICRALWGPDSKNAIEGACKSSYIFSPFVGIHPLLS